MIKIFGNTRTIAAIDLSTNKLKDRFIEALREMWAINAMPRYSEDYRIKLKDQLETIEQLQSLLYDRAVVSPTENFEWDYFPRAEKAGRTLIRLRDNRVKGYVRTLSAPLANTGTEKLQEAYVSLYKQLWNAGRYNTVRFIQTHDVIGWEQAVVQGDLKAIWNELRDRGIELPPLLSQSEKRALESKKNASMFV